MAAGTRGINGNACANGRTIDNSLTVGHHISGKLMTENERTGGDEVAASTMRIVVEVAAADACRTNGDENLARPGLGHGDMLLADVFRAVENECFHDG